MNEKALANKESTSPTAPAKRIAMFGWLIRLAAVAAILLGLLTLLSSYLDSATNESDSSEIEPVVIIEPSNSETPLAPVPISSITSCIDQQLIDDAEHPLMPLIEMAQHGADVVTRNVKDYTAIITKRVRVGGKLQPEHKIMCKIRHAVAHEDQDKAIPFSVYTKFLNVKKGQEAIWVENRNENKLIAHGPSGLLNLVTLRLDPTGGMAMSGNRYPIMSIGMLNLVKKMIEKGTADLNHDDCEVVLTRNVQVGDARCTRIEIIHEEKSDQLEYHKAEIYIDDDRNLPIAFRSYLWPEKPGGRPILLERYSYSDIELNVGLDDSDFDPANEAYDYPGM